MESLIPVLERLAERLGTTVAHLWVVLTYQARIEIATTIIYSVATAVGLVVLIRWWRRLARDGRTKDVLDGFDIGQIVAAVVVSVLVLILVVISIDRVAAVPTLIANPEYWALRQILDAVGGKP